jgi:5-methyltetrahydropteroyltriglutamate--homocysteine methyltransferase
LLTNKALEEYKEAKAIGITTRPVILGPLSFILLGKKAREASAGFQPIDILPKLLPVYKQLLSELKEAGVEWVQVDEPILVLESAGDYAQQFTSTYKELAKVAPKIVLTTYFGRLESNVNFVAGLPIAALHIDLDREPAQLGPVLDAIKDTSIILSLGVVSGRNIWKNDFAASIDLGKKAIASIGPNRVIIATSSSLLHTPVTLASEKKLSARHRDFFSFALEKAHEVAIISAILSGSTDAFHTYALEANRESIARRREFESTSDDAVRKRVQAITHEHFKRKSDFPVRRAAQEGHLNLPRFPTTTIGSFPVSYLSPHSRRTRH